MKLFGKSAKSKRSNKTADSTSKIDENESVKFAYIHIGKTGGSSIANISRKAAEAGYPTPKKLGHDTRLAAAAKSFPNAQFSFTIRDPIARIISAFDSRLRQSRPSYTALWRPEEAISYLWFPTSLDFFKALLSSDERQKSAGLFAKQNLGHIRRGYEFHFESKETLFSLENRIYYVGELEGGFQAQVGYFEPVGVPKAFLEKNYAHAHSGGSSTKASISEIPDGMLNELVDYFRTEYEIYSDLKRISAKLL